MSTLTEDVVLARSRASSLSKVKKLNCWGSGLSDISILQKMPNVEVVTLSVNEISSLRDFAYCPKLKELYLRKNNIANLDEIKCLKDLPGLKVLWLSDNPCSELEDYKSTILMNLPNIEKLDNVDVSSEDVSEVWSHPKGISLVASCNDVDISSSAEHSGYITSEFLQSKGTSCEQHSAEESTQGLLDETNKLRTQLGLKPLVIEETSAHVQITETEKRQLSHDTERKTTTKTSNLLSAVLLLLTDMNEDELQVVQKAVDVKLEAMREKNNVLEQAKLITEQH